MNWGTSIIIFGGIDVGMGVLNDLHMLDTKCHIGMPGSPKYGRQYCETPLKPMIWRPVKAIGTPPKARWGHVMLALDPISPKAMVITGYSTGGDYENWLDDIDQNGFRNDNAILDVKSPVVTFAKVNAHSKTIADPYSFFRPRVPKW